MNDRPTPETDAQPIVHCTCVPLLLGKIAALRKERDEARQALAAIAALPRVEHKYWEESDGHIDESWDESDDGMYLLHYKVAEILREAAE